MSHKNVNPKMKAVKTAQASTIAKSPIFDQKYLQWVLIALLFLIVSALYFPVAFKGMSPQTSDIRQWQGAAKSVIDYNQSHQDNALWTQNMFSGMPSYMISFPHRYPFLENITKLTDKVMSWKVFLLFIGGLGVFVMFKQLRLGNWIAFFGAIAFMFSCHWMGLIEIGHNTKFRAIMYLPWVFWSILYLKAKPGILSLGLFSTLLIAQLRENHPQITYYLYLFLGMYWLFELIESVREKKLKDFGTWTGLILLAMLLTVLAVANPYLSTMEYSHFTMRGGAAGLEKSYAQSWSFHPKEIIGLVIPDFWGGINQTYWGYMPFTQVYNYFGLVVLALGVLALWSSHKRLAIFLWLSSIAFTLMSFGSATPALSDLFFKYLPYFNKFRVPAMTLTMVQFNAVILAGLGLKGILENAGNPIWQKRYLRIFWICGAIFLLWIVGAKGAFKGLEFSTPTELARYEQAGALDRMGDVKAQRLDILVKSGILSLMFLVVSMGIAYLASIKKLKEGVFVFLITLVAFLDLWVYTGKYLKNLYPQAEHQSVFQMRDFDQFLLADKDNYRIYPFNTGQIRTAGEWAYYHQTIDGYSAAKLKRYDDILKLITGDGTKDGEFIRYLKGIFQEEGKEYPLPILNMLSTKYVIIPDSLPNGSFLQQIKPVFSNGQLTIYRNMKAMPRAWFAKTIEVIPQADKLLEKLSDSSFDPAQTALLEAEIQGIVQPDSAVVKQTKSEMHELAYELSTSSDALLTLSEVYYPAGWKAFIDGKETPILPVNYILRGVVIPAGSHNLELKMLPDSYARSVKLSSIGIGLTLLAVLGGIALHFRKSILSRS